MILLISTIITINIIFLMSLEKSINLKKISFFFFYFNIFFLFYYYILNFFLIIIFYIFLFFNIIINNCNLQIFVDIYLNIINSSNTYCLGENFFVEDSSGTTSYIRINKNISDSFFMRNNVVLNDFHSKAMKTHITLDSEINNQLSNQKFIFKKEKIFDRLESYKVTEINRFITTYDSNTNNFFLKDLNLSNNNYSPNMQTELPIVKYFHFFKYSFNNFYKYDMKKTTDPYLNFKDIALFLTKTTSICKNLGIEILESKESKRIENYQFINLIDYALLPYFKKTYLYLYETKMFLERNELYSLHFQKTITTLFEIQDLSFQDLKIIKNIIGNNKDLAPSLSVFDVDEKIIIDNIINNNNIDINNNNIDININSTDLNGIVIETYNIFSETNSTNIDDNDIEYMVEL